MAVRTRHLHKGSPYWNELSVLSYLLCFSVDWKCPIIYNPCSRRRYRWKYGKKWRPDSTIGGHETTLQMRQSISSTVGNRIPFRFGRGRQHPEKIDGSGNTLQRVYINLPDPIERARSRDASVLQTQANKMLRVWETASQAKNQDVETKKEAHEPGFCGLNLLHISGALFCSLLRTVWFIRKCLARFGFVAKRYPKHDGVLCGAVACFPTIQKLLSNRRTEVGVGELTTDRRRSRQKNARADSKRKFTSRSLH